MSDFVRPDVLFRVPIIDGELLLSPSHDFIHHFERNGAYILKYIDMESDPPCPKNVPINEAGAFALRDTCQIEILEREFMGEQEYEHYLQFQSSRLEDMFDTAEGDEQ